MELFAPQHLLVILIVALLVFGPKKIPELGKALGEGIRGFKDGIKDSPNAAHSAAQNANTGTETKA